MRSIQVINALMAALLPVTLIACSAPRSPLQSIDIALGELQPTFTGNKLVFCLATPLATQMPCRDAIVQSMLVAIRLRYAEFELNFSMQIAASASSQRSLRLCSVPLAPS